MSEAGLILNPPTTLSFKRPFNTTVKEILNVTNPSGLKVAFKVKTTSPKLYCVRPNAGILEPHETKEIQVLLQPQKGEEIPLDAKSKDKFLLQSFSVKEEHKDLGLTELWAVYEKDHKEQLREAKLKCVYVNPASNGAAVAAQSDDAVAEPVVEAAPSFVQNKPEKLGLANRVPQTSSSTYSSPAKTVEAKPVAAKEAPVQAQAGTITKTKSTGYTLQIVILLVIVAFGLGFQLSNIAFP